MWANADTEKLDLQGHKGAGYFGVIQVIDFCNGKVIADQLPPESCAEQGPGRGNVIHSLQDLVVGMAFLLSQFLLNSWGGGAGILSYLFLPPPSPTPSAWCSASPLAGEREVQPITGWQEETRTYRHEVLRPLGQRATEKQLRQMQTQTGKWLLSN